MERFKALLPIIIPLLTLLAGSGGAQIIGPTATERDHALEMIKIVSALYEKQLDRCGKPEPDKAAEFKVETPDKKELKQYEWYKETPKDLRANIKQQSSVAVEK